MAEERLQKILARAGIASRRAAEQLILAGRVHVNGRVTTELGTKADPERDHIRVDGKLIRQKRAGFCYFIAFKPEKMLTTMSDPGGRPTVKDLLRAHGVRERVYPVGRLDWDTDGLLLLTDDGDLADRIMRPRSHMPKVYRVKVKGHPSEESLKRLRGGVPIGGPKGTVRTLPAGVEVERRGETTTWLRLTLVEGRQNQIKKMLLAVGHPVRKLRRVAIGPLRLGRLRRGEMRRLTPVEVERLRRAVGEDLPATRRGSRRRKQAPTA